jgi:poly(3-hydroxybutyrate) depolymerase
MARRPLFPMLGLGGSIVRFWMWFWLLAGLFILAWWTVLWLPAGGPKQGEMRGGDLPRLHAQAIGVTVSGISSGAYMAGQMQMAYSESVSGAALIAGGPFGCAESAFAGMATDGGAAMLNAQRAVAGCMLDRMAMWGVPDPGALARQAERLASDGRIGPLEAVASDRIYLFTGRADSIVKPSIVRAAKAYYEKIGVPAGQIRFNDTLAAGHAFVTPDKGGACDVSSAPYVVDCDYDQAGELLNTVLGGAQKPSGPAAGRFIDFDQTPFTAGLANHGMAKRGVVYVPESCVAEAGCRIHVAFHGCAQNRAAVGDAFVRDTGFGPWADANRLIVLFPEVSPGATNPQGCWDWWGYTGRAYLTRDAPQLRAVARMIEHLAAKPPAQT